MSNETVTQMCFRALSDPIRRSLLVLLGRNPCTVNELVAQFDVSRPAISRHLRVLSEIRRMPNDKFGPNAFFILDYRYSVVQWYGRVYSLEIDEAEDAIRMKLYFFTDTDPAPYLNAHEDISVLDDLAPEDLTHMPECDIFWRPLVHGYEGTM